MYRELSAQSTWIRKDNSLWTCFNVLCTNKIKTDNSILGLWIKAIVHLYTQLQLFHTFEVYKLMDVCKYEKLESYTR